MKAAPGTASIEPTVCTAAAHLAVDNDATGPWAVALVTILAGDTSGLASDVGKQGFDIAPPRQVEDLLWPALLGEALAGLPG